MKSFHRLIPFLPLMSNCQPNSIPLLQSSYPGRLASRYSTPFNADPASFGILLCNHFVRTTQKIQPLYCWEGMFTALLHSNGSNSTVACVFVAAGMCLPSRCLAVNAYSDFAFGRHVTIIQSTAIVKQVPFTAEPLKMARRAETCKAL
jgi:hypothetical protein